jgi:adenosine deaminase
MPSNLPQPSVDGLVAFVDALPKVELHVHLEGSIAPSTLLTLARSQPDSLLPRDEEGLRALYRFRDFAHFLEIYQLICRQLRRAEDREAAAAADPERAAREASERATGTHPA